MSEYLAAAVLGLFGLVMLVVASVIVSTAKARASAVKWVGFGVTFEIRPCEKCACKRATDDKSSKR